MKTIEYEAECSNCNSTGLYQGFAEQEGFAIVCRTCKGTGCRSVKVEYTPFRNRRDIQNINRVLESNPGIGVGIDKERDLTIESFGGITYKEWAGGLGFPRGTEMRNYTCPCWWYQHTDHTKKPNWDECNKSLGRSFSNCPSFENKEKCWERFDKESN